MSFDVMRCVSFTAEELKETEKAVLYAFFYKPFETAVDYLPFEVWIPKSVIITAEWYDYRGRTLYIVFLPVWFTKDNLPHHTYLRHDV